MATQCSTRHPISGTQCTREAGHDGAHEAITPAPLLTYMTTGNKAERHAAYLRIHASHIRDGTTEDIPNTVAATVEMVADHLTAVHQALAQLLDQWRANADMLAEGNKSEHTDPSVGMQRACADQLEAVLAASHP